MDISYKVLEMNTFNSDVFDWNHLPWLNAVNVTGMRTPDQCADKSAA